MPGSQVKRLSPAPPRPPRPLPATLTQTLISILPSLLMRLPWSPSLVSSILPIPACLSLQPSTARGTFCKDGNVLCLCYVATSHTWLLSIWIGACITNQETECLILLNLNVQSKIILILWLVAICFMRILCNH